MSSPDREPGVRIGDAERDAAATALGEHFAAGRLGQAELEERLTATWAARHHGELAALFTDLPEPGPPPAPAPSARPDPPPPDGTAPPAATGPGGATARPVPPGPPERRRPAMPGVPRWVVVGGVTLVGLALLLTRGRAVALLPLLLVLLVLAGGRRR